MARHLLTDVHVEHDGERKVVKAGTKYAKWMDGLIGPHCFGDSAPAPEPEEEEIKLVEPIDLAKASVDDMIAWVGDDQDRAAQALEVEVAGRKRTTALDFLNGLLDG